jgi:hypothetical protein
LLRPATASAAGFWRPRTAPTWAARGSGRQTGGCSGSPLGWDGGDSDRYLPAILLGCIPVFLQAHEERPLEELLPWDDFSVRIRQEQIAELHLVLEGYSPERVVQMRRAMASAWEYLLFSSYPPSELTLHRDVLEFKLPQLDPRTGQRPNVTSYLGEDGRRDAFHGLMRVLRGRLQRWAVEDEADAARGMRVPRPIATPPPERGPP